MFLVDTGAEVSLVKYGVSENDQAECSLEARGVTGNSLRITGSQIIDVWIGEGRYPHQFLVCALDIPYSAILGADFLRKYGARIDFDKMLLRLRDEVIPCEKRGRREGEVHISNSTAEPNVWVVKLTSNTILPPYSEGLVEVTVYTAEEDASPEWLVIEPMMTKVAGLRVARALTCPISTGRNPAEPSALGIVYEESTEPVLPGVMKRSGGTDLEIESGNSRACDYCDNVERDPQDLGLPMRVGDQQYFRAGTSEYLPVTGSQSQPN